MNSSRTVFQALHALSLFAVYLPLAGAAEAAGNPADAFRRLAADTWITRSVKLSELGFTGPVVLASTDTLREIYLPVPANVPLTGAALQLDANYLRADRGRTTMVVSIDSYPVSARGFTEERGDASAPLGVDGTPRPSGFVRLGINWTNAHAGQSVCADARTPGNILRVEPTTRFTYRYDGAAVRDLTTAWGALPATTTILISGNNLPAASYDTAWRLGVAMERAGKHGAIKILPAVGDTVDMDGISIPAGLRAIPAFAALAEGGKHKIKDAAEAGALIALGQNGPFRADVIVSDQALTTSLTKAFNALADQVKTAAPDASAAFSEWRARVEPAAKPIGSNEVRLGSAFGRPAILVSPDAGAKAAALFGEYWRTIGVSSAVALQAVDTPPADGSVISLKALGGSPASFDVLGRAEWTMSFDIAAVSANGRLPATLELDISAAPGAARTAPVAAVFLNDILLGARQLNANGARERISARIPRYALAARNVLKVSFVRQLSSDACRETPEAFPVAVLASSHLVLDKSEPELNFTGMLSRFSTETNVMLPQNYLSDASNTLPRVINIATSTGVSAVHATMSVIATGKEQDPSSSFLAIDVPFKDGKNLATIDGGRLVLADGSKRALLDISGLDHVGTLQMARIGGQSGIVYRTVGANPPTLEKPFKLSRGNFAVIGSAGLLKELDTENASGRDLIQDDNEFSLRKAIWWGIPILAIALFIVLMVYASRMRRRRAVAKSKL